jgi:energy-coupling factor transporter transmembrane protein EcfT
MFTRPVALILLTLWYQFLDRSWYAISLILLILFAFTALYIFIFVPESPKWLYSWGKTSQSKDVILQIGRANSIS